ncbi:zf-ZPR1-domain-containing protein [Coniochaeta ligniaria NRRL 30616]|uniref:Zf-ZPR1-domain-containing protein n=1 Tax=Coniochaeta ligniaria NRRL 30616 TaxID=1408157 RepID=A0A1J7J2F9_9PEZI|nr:zf-ZPR1-domain-containing protein [Coniochaeta ligniaria NRRL 30616]
MSSHFDPIGQKVEQLDSKATTKDTNGEPVDDNDDERLVEQIESLCMNCHKNGTTRLLLTAIPYFREIILMSFQCDECGFQNNEIQAANELQAKGARYELRLFDMADFERQVVKSDTATVKFIELDVEVPPGRGQLTNIEGLLSTVIDDLESNQGARREQQPEVAAKVQDIIDKGRAMLAGTAFPFRVAIDDPAGNSFIAPDPRDGVGKWEKREYLRTSDQNEMLGLADTRSSITTGLGEPEDNVVSEQVYQFPSHCPGCMHPCTTNMKMVDIPHFRQVVLMNTSCDDCGYKSNDVKTGGEIPKLGKKITLRVKSNIDLARDILKSESCALECPELHLSVNPGTLGGRFTTVEGLLTNVRDDLKSQIFETGTGHDGLSEGEKTRWTEFFEDLDKAVAGEREFSIILADPLAASYVQSLADDPGQPDEQMTVEEYERTEEEEEDLGLKDMKTENYAEDAEGAKEGEAAA